MMRPVNLAGLIALLPLTIYASAIVDTPQVSTSFSILQDITQALMLKSDGKKVYSLVGLNGNSHTYQLKVNDVQVLQNSRLIVFNGLGFESAALERAAHNSHVPLIEAGSGLDHLLQSSDDHDHEQESPIEHAKHTGHAYEDGTEHLHEPAQKMDPHVWLDPLNMPRYTANITQGLIKRQPENALQYGLRWQFYQLKLAKLHAENVHKLADIPLQNRKVLSSHAAFAYMGRRYDIEFLAPVTGGHEAEASAKTLVDLIKQVRTQHIRAVFIENTNDTRLLQQLSKETGLVIQGKLYSDALSSDAPDYFSFYRHNIETLVKALRH